MTSDDEDSQPRDHASRRISWPAFAIAIAGLFGGLFGSIEGFFANLITVFGMHLNWKYDKDDAQKASDRDNDPIFRTE